MLVVKLVDISFALVVQWVEHGNAFAILNPKI